MGFLAMGLIVAIISQLLFEKQHRLVLKANLADFLAVSAIVVIEELVLVCEFPRVFPVLAYLAIETNLLSDFLLHLFVFIMSLCL